MESPLDLHCRVTVSMSVIILSSSDSLCLLLCGGAVHPERSEKGLCSHHRFSPRTTSYCRAVVAEPQPCEKSVEKCAALLI